MKTDRPDPDARLDANAELHTREPMRVVFALAALLLGLIAAIQP